MNLFIIFLILITAFSCSHDKKEPADLIIEGNVAGLPDTKLYLVEAKKWRTPLDSAECKNGRFVFRIRTDSSFVPYLAAIHFLNNGNPDKPVRLQFRNHTLGADSLLYLRDAFYPERGTISIRGGFNTAPYLRISAGKETELLFKNQFDDIGWMGGYDMAKRNEKMKRLRKKIQEHRGSFFLLQSIYDFKEQYSKAEIMQLLTLFDNRILQSAAIKKFNTYLALRPDAGAAYPGLQLLSSKNKLLPLIDTSAKVNMLVFWASWCLPCRKEVPQLKELHKKFSGDGLHIVSVSIDLSQEQWLAALQQDQMPWTQLIISKDRIEETENIFGFTTIPFVVFTDRRGKEIARFADYDENNPAKYEELIMRFSRYCRSFTYRPPVTTLALVAGCRS